MRDTATEPVQTNTTQMMQCRHGMPEAWCSVCRNREPVYVSGGGTHYHRTAACPSLMSGQDKVLRRGGVTAAVRNVTKSAALAECRVPCRTCWRGRS